jgi:hypothetical protein
MKTVAVQHYRLIQQIHFVRPITGLQADKWAFRTGASTFAGNQEISTRLYETSVNSVLRNPLRARAAQRGVRAAGVGGQTYIVEMAAGHLSPTAAHQTWIANGVNQIEPNEWGFR